MGHVPQVPPTDCSLRQVPALADSRWWSASAWNQSTGSLFRRDRVALVGLRQKITSTLTKRLRGVGRNPDFSRTSVSDVLSIVCTNNRATGFPSLPPAPARSTNAPVPPLAHSRNNALHMKSPRRHRPDPNPPSSAQPSDFLARFFWMHGRWVRGMRDAGPPSVRFDGPVCATGSR